MFRKESFCPLLLRALFNLQPWFFFLTSLFSKCDPRFRKKRRRAKKPEVYINVFLQLHFFCLLCSIVNSVKHKYDVLIGETFSLKKLFSLSTAKREKGMNC